MSIAEIKQDIIENYNNPTHAISYGGVGRVHEYYKGAISKKVIENVLSQIDTYSLSKQERKAKVFNETLTYHARDLIQADLFFTDRLEQYNDGVRAILLCIDTYTKFCWLEPLKSKNCTVVVRAFRRILDRMTFAPKVFAFDNGSEFTCLKTRKLFEALNIKTFFAYSDNKCALAERAQRSIQSRLYKHLLANETYRYIDNLQQLVLGYNNSSSRMLRMSPIQAEQPKNWERLADQHARNRAKRSKLKKKSPKFNVGQEVRISLEKSVFTRGYDVSFTHQRYIVKEVIQHRKLPAYVLANEKGELVKGRFREHQLTAINTPYYRGNVLKQRVRKGKKQYLMRWIGYPEEYDIWIDAQDVEKL